MGAQQQRAELLDFGSVKVVTPQAPLSASQWGDLRAALSLAGRNLTAAADLVLETAGLIVWPPRKRRTTRPWTDAEKILVIANYTTHNEFELSRMVGRSSSAVAFMLAERGLKAVRFVVATKKGRRTDAPTMIRSDDAAHVVAVMLARDGGYRR